MRIWLDDIRPKPDHFTVHVRTAEEAIDLLKTGQVEEISLDNDLGLDENGNELTQGKKVAQWMEEEAFYGRLNQMKLNHHTDNVAAQKEMDQAFQNIVKFWKGQE